MNSLIKSLKISKTILTISWVIGAFAFFIIFDYFRENYSFSETAIFFTPFFYLVRACLGEIKIKYSREVFLNICTSFILSVIMTDSLYW